MTMNCHAAPEDDPRIVTRATGPRRELSVCRVCGEEYPERPFDDGTCGDRLCRDALTRMSVDPWLVGREMR